MAGSYASATSDGTTIGQRNLSPLQLSGVSITIQYNNTSNAAPGAAGWASAAPTSSTRSVKAQATGTYNTLFLKLLQVPTVSVDRLAVITIRGGVLPLGVCGSVTSALPSGPWIIYQDGVDQCRPPGPPTAPPPATGATGWVDRTGICNTATNQPGNWLATTYYTNNPTQPIVVLDITSNSTSVPVLGCRLVQLTVVTATNTVTASNPGPLTDCTAIAGLQQTS